MATKTKTKKEPAVGQAFLFAFEGNLKRGDTNDVNEAVCDIEDIPCGGDDDYLIRFNELPKEIPEAIRKQLVAKSREAYRIQNEIQDMIGALSRVANKVLTAKEREDERNQPHCKTCGQVVKSKRR